MASMLLSAVLLAILVVAVVHAGWSFGSFTLVLTVAMALVVLPVEAWRFLVLGPLVGLASTWPCTGVRLGYGIWSPAPRLPARLSSPAAS